SPASHTFWWRSCVKVMISPRPGTYGSGARLHAANTASAAAPQERSASFIVVTNPPSPIRLHAELGRAVLRLGHLPAGPERQPRDGLQARVVEPVGAVADLVVVGMLAVAQEHDGHALLREVVVVAALVVLVAARELHAELRRQPRRALRDRAVLRVLEAR